MTKIERKFRVAGDIKLELVNVFEPGEVFIEGTVMLERAKRTGANLNQETIKIVLENKHLLPEELKGFDIVLLGTVRRIGSRKIKVISYLRNKGGNWVEGFGGVRYDWGERARLLRACAQ